MPRIPPVQEIAEKWNRVTRGRTQDYERGVNNPRQDWKDSTVAAKDIWKAQMSAVIASTRWEGGVERSGSRNWKEKTLSKGPRRWAEGVGLAIADFARGFLPYRDLISQIELPARGEAGSPQNEDRMLILARALHELKLRIQGGGG